MDKHLYFLKAIEAKAHFNTSWVFHCFTKTREKPQDWLKDPYPYRLVKNQEGVFYVDPTQSGKLSAITGFNEQDPNGPLFDHRDEFSLQVGEYEYLKEPVQTTYGSLLTTAILDYSFKGRLGFINDVHVAAGKIEKTFAPMIRSEPPEGQERDPQFFYSDDLDRYFEAIFMFSEFSMIFTPSDTEKSLSEIPGLYELRDKLFAQYEGQLHIPAIEAKIGDEMVAYAKEYLKGDDAEGILTSGKDWSVIRKKLFMFTGKEGGLVYDPNAQPIKQSLMEGWDLTRFVDYVNNIRAGSYSRGIETALGGELAKWLLRAFSNANVDGKDCGTRYGMDWLIDKSNIKNFLGCYFIDDEGQTHPFTEEVGNSYIGKVIQIRSPSYCSQVKTDYCEKCIGDAFASDPTSIGSGATAIGNRFMNIVMKAMHGRILATTKYDPMVELS